MLSHRHRQKNGFTLLETTIALGVSALLVFGAMSVLSQPAENQRVSETVQRLNQLKKAILGDPRVVTKEARTDFGFVGAMGSLPSSLEELWISSAQPLFAFDTSLRVGAGWSGPYATLPTTDYFDDFTRDSWGNTIQYVVGTGVSAVTGQTYRAQLISYGPDGELGTSDDLTCEIYETEMLATITGYIRDANGNALTGVSAKLHHPSSGALTFASATTDSNGAYTFSDIPFGSRSLAVEPKLVYVVGSAFVKGGAGDRVEFVIQNFSADDVTITKFKAEFDVTAFWEDLIIGNQTVYNGSSGSRIGDNVEVDFSGDPQTIAGTGSSTAQIVPLRVQSPYTLALDQDIGKTAQAGATERIKISNFRTADTGNTSVDMTGVSIRVTFTHSDATTSVAILVPES